MNESALQIRDSDNILPCLAVSVVSVVAGARAIWTDVAVPVFRPIVPVDHRLGRRTWADGGCRIAAKQSNATTILGSTEGNHVLPITMLARDN